MRSTCILVFFLLTVQLAALAASAQAITSYLELPGSATPLALAAELLATFGVLDLAGSFDDPEDRVAGRATLTDEEVDDFLEGRY